MAEQTGLSIELNCDRYVSLLSKLIGETEFLQNNPPKFVPQEDRAIKHLLDVLNPHSTTNGGPLTLDHVAYVEGRGNLIIGYSPPSATQGTVSFVGSHLDCVPANPETWERNPFKLTQEGDKLYGRGTTDCLGHVALITDLFIQLAEKKPPLKRSVYFSVLNTRGPCSKYSFTNSVTGEEKTGKIEFKLTEEIFKGIACKLDSPGFIHLNEATKEVIGSSTPYSDCGSLPLVADLQEAGFDVQITGYGHSDVYHGDNEYCSLSCMQSAMKILSRVLDKFNQ
ncbi:PREDICTED: acetylornithine deacetylase-like [Amphimedon queenslandica]|uniref:Peptidase M20 dimerisation domain-containing protein n=1 Tax=Amphimedon queenslandica TaxID=400682 RepID=A0AAN0J183_AMPQE|nr:PREDICTED: acetylornithine deacetylase-like [Amphimedon queenslandica]|eukprot:XP_019850498.1 PREDICTED: acetylornithine deacetylase-like [Amphimedon queenslandica]